MAAEGALLPVEAGLQVTFGAVALIAEAAAERLLASVGQHEGVEPSHLPEGFPADVTQELPLASVNAFVDLQDVDRGQALSAGLAGADLRAVGGSVSGVALDVGGQSSVDRLSTELEDVWSLPRADPPVVPEGSWPREGHPPDAAGVRFDAGMNPHVSLHVQEAFSRCGRSF